MTQLEDDFSRYYRDRIGDITDDVLDTMDIADMPRRTCRAIIIHNLLLHAACLGIAEKLSKDEFVRACEHAYDKVTSIARERP